MNNKDENKLLSEEIKTSTAEAVRLTIIALTVIMTAISMHLSHVIDWLKDLKQANKDQQLTIKALLAQAIGLGRLQGWPEAIKEMLERLSAPQALIELTKNQRVRWLLEYIGHTYESMNIMDVMTLASQAGIIGSAIDEELNPRCERSYRVSDKGSSRCDEKIADM